MKHASKVMDIVFTPRCLCNIYDGDNPGDFVCSKPNNLNLLPNSTKYLFIKLPMNLSTKCKYILVDIQLKE